MDPETPDAFEAITEELAELRTAARAEHLGEAREIEAAELAGRWFRDELRRIAPGDVVTVVAGDGQPLRGRVLRVGADWLRLGEVADGTGSARVRLRRVHDVALAAIVRVTRDPET
jgi:translation initiation factor IF-1